MHPLYATEAKVKMSFCSNDVRRKVFGGMLRLALCRCSTKSIAGSTDQESGSQKDNNNNNDNNSHLLRSSHDEIMCSVLCMDYLMEYSFFSFLIKFIG